MNLEREKTAKFLQSGDREAFEWLYLKHRKAFERYAHILTGGVNPQDLIQLVCLQVLQYDGRHKDPATFRFESFFARSLRNTLINLHRTRREVHELPEEYALADTVYKEKNLQPLVYHIEKYLTPVQKQVTYLRMQGVKFKFICLAMGLKKNTAVGIFRQSRMVLKKFEKEILEL